MKKVLTFGFAILAVIAMLFSGIAAAQSTGSMTSTQKGGSTTSTQVAGNTTSTKITEATTLAITGVKPSGKENVQLSNLGGTTVALADYTITIDGGDQFSLPSATLGPGNDVVIYFSSGTSADGSSYYLNGREDVLRDVSGTITLNNLDGDKISSLSYDNIYSANNRKWPTNTASSSVPTTSTSSS